MLEIVILAAGASSRLGSSKQLLTINGESLVYRAANTASKLAAIFNLKPPLVIVGKDQTEVKQSITDLPVLTIYNAQWQQGMGYSIATAVNHLDAQTSAVLIMTCDQVLLNSELLKPMIKKWQSNRQQIIASTYQETIGIPVIFPRQCFTELLKLNSDKGARQVIEKYKPQLLLFDLPEAAQDLDTREDAVQIRQLIRNSTG